jgi:hypothetical protein
MRYLVDDSLQLERAPLLAFRIHGGMARLARWLLSTLVAQGLPALESDTYRGVLYKWNVVSRLQPLNNLKSIKFAKTKNKDFYAVGMGRCVGSRMR